MSLLNQLAAFNAAHRAASKCDVCGLPTKAGFTTTPILARATRERHGLCVCDAPANDPALEAIETDLVKRGRIENAKNDAEAAQ